MSTGLILVPALWAACVPCSLLALSGYVRIARERGFRERGRWHAPLLFTSAALALFAALASATVTMAALAFLAVLPLALIAAMVYRAWEATAQVNGKGAATRLVLAGLWRCVRHELRGSRDDLRALTGRRREEGPQQASPRAASAPPAAAAPSSAPDARPAQAREVPPIREDPALGAAPQATDVAAGLATAGVEIPEPWAQLIAYVAGRVAEDSNEQDRFLLGDAAGFIGLGEAYHSHGASVVDEIGLDPAYGSAILDIGDAVADKSGDVVQGYRRFHLIYEAIVQAVENGVIMPFNGRFFGDGGGSAPQDGPSESAA